MSIEKMDEFQWFFFGFSVALAVVGMLIFPVVYCATNETVKDAGAYQKILSGEIVLAEKK